MSREEKNKFGNFVHEQRKKEDEILEICQDIFRNSRNELAVSMHFFQSALSGLKVVPSAETQVIGTDGKLLYVSPAVAASHVYAEQDSDQQAVSP